jgi:hypothetical protein
MTAKKAYDQPTNTDAVAGEVTLNGPDGVGLSMTPDAAEATAHRLIEAAAKARQQPKATEDDSDQT